MPVFTYAGEAFACSLEGAGECAANGMEVEWHSRYFGAIGVLLGLGLVVKYRGAPYTPDVAQLGVCRRRMLRLVSTHVCG